MKSILLHIYDDTGLESRLQAAFDLARCFGGHITCLHATPFEDYLATDPLVVAALPVEFSGKMERKRKELQARVEERLRSEGMLWEWIHVDDLMTTALIRHSILADVIVLSLAGPALMRDEPRPLAASVATGAPAPVLAVPQSTAGYDPAAPAMIAWNGSPEAAAALRSALPVLRATAGVHLLQVEEKASHYPRDMAARYLARHGIEAEIVQRRPIDGSVSEAIRAAAREFGAGTVVMGAYGHSRLREFLLGGVTHDLLAESAVPLLLGH